MLDLSTPLGHGTDGSVWRTGNKTAVKALEHPKNYTTELTCYQRFASNRVTNIQGFSIPQLIGHDDRLLVIEMRIVTAPYILDFAKAYLDRRPDYPEATWNDWEAEGIERFEDRWPQVKSLIWGLQKYGIYYYDAKPANIAFAESPAD